MVKGLKMKQLNKDLKNSFAKLRLFPGAKTKQLSYYAFPLHVVETPNKILIYGGCNGISNKNYTPKKIENDVLEKAKTCRAYGTNDAFQSAIICRRNKLLGEKVKYINVLLKQICQENEYIYIDKENIEVRDLWL